jgi:uncharacterized SAM-binding protein YcdF (DUF218 family)
MKKAVLNAVALAGSVLAIYICYLSVRIEQQSLYDEAQKADVIVVLGAAGYHGRPSPVLRARLDHALELYKQGIAPRIMTTGGAGGDPIYTEGGVGRAYLIGRGVPSEAIIVESEGATTVHTIAAAAEIMQRMGLHSAVAVSDGYHIFRVKRLLQARGVQTYGSPRPSVRRENGIRERWKYLRQAIGYTLWRLGMPV